MTCKSKLSSKKVTCAFVVVLGIFALLGYSAATADAGTKMKYTPWDMNYRAAKRLTLLPFPHGWNVTLYVTRGYSSKKAPQLSNDCVYAPKPIGVPSDWLPSWGYLVFGKAKLLEYPCVKPDPSKPPPPPPKPKSPGRPMPQLGSPYPGIRRAILWEGCQGFNTILYTNSKAMSVPCGGLRKYNGNGFHVTLTGARCVPWRPHAMKRVTLTLRPSTGPIVLGRILKTPCKGKPKAKNGLWLNENRRKHKRGHSSTVAVSDRSTATDAHWYAVKV